MDAGFRHPRFDVTRNFAVTLSRHPRFLRSPSICLLPTLNCKNNELSRPVRNREVA
jgi:hypothetical protein